MRSSYGTDFWLTFLPNLDEGGHAITNEISVTASTAGSVTVTGGGMSSAITKSLGANQALTLVVPTVTLADNTVATNAFHVVTTVPATVQSTNDTYGSSDGYLAIPTASLGTSYDDVSYESFSSSQNQELAVIATKNDTTITIVPSETIGTGRTAGAAFTESLNAGQTYTISAGMAEGDDLTGTQITADQPVAVVSGNQCDNVPNDELACNQLVEEMPPTDEVGRQYITVPFATRTGGDFLRAIGLVNGTTVEAAGGSTVGVPASLNRGQIVTWTQTTPLHLVATEPFILMQYSTGTYYDDDADGDPFMVLVPSVDQDLASYTFATAPITGLTHEISIALPTSAASTVRLDGKSLPSGTLTTVTDNKAWSTGSVSVAAGAHRITASRPLGVQVYGYGPNEEYGDLAGQNFAKIDDVSSIKVTAAAPAQIGHSSCVTMAALDSSADPVPGVRFDVSVSGVNPSTGYAFANTSGVSSFCWPVTKVGLSSVAVEVGSADGGTDTSALVAAVTKLKASPGAGKAGFTWTNPDTRYFSSKTMVRFQAGRKTPTATTGQVLYDGRGHTAKATHLKPGTTYSFAFFATDPRGHLSPGATRTLAGTTLSVKVSAGSGAATLSTVLRQAGVKTGVKGVKIELLKRSGAKLTVVKKLTTKKGGRASYRLRLTKTTTFVWEFAGAGTRLGSASKAVTVHLR